MPDDGPVRPKHFVEFQRKNGQMLIQPMTCENAFKIYCVCVYLVMKLVQQDA
jgi:hypothetical protein